MSKFKYKNILLTGAAGALGNELREKLSKECKSLRISDKLKLDKILFLLFFDFSIISNPLDTTISSIKSTLKYFAKPKDIRIVFFEKKINCK